MKIAIQIGREGMGGIVKGSIREAVMEGIDRH